VDEKIYYVEGVIRETKELKTKTGNDFIACKILDIQNNLLEASCFDSELLDKLQDLSIFNFKIEQKGNYKNIIELQEVNDEVTNKFLENISKFANVKPVKKELKETIKVSGVDSYFSDLVKTPCEVEKKGQFNYVSWAEAWKLLKLKYPDATSKVYENQEGLPYFSTLKGAFVKVGVKVKDIEHICWYPVLDNQNKEVKLENLDVFILNKSLQRALAKAIALHGLGLYVFKGEDLPE